MEHKSDDVKTTFLNAVIDEEVYIEQPQGFEVHGRECPMYADRRKHSTDSSKILKLGIRGLIPTCNSEVS